MVTKPSKSRTAVAVLAAAALAVPAAPGAAEAQGQATAPVLVTATRTPVPVGGAGGSVDIVTAEDIEAAGAPDVKAALALVPTLVLSDGAGPGAPATVSLRGSTSQQVLVLVDGRRVATAQSSWFNLNDLELPVERVARIEVVPTPSSALYGADALGGVVNIVTRPAGRDPGFNVALGTGSHNAWRTAGGLQYGIGAVGLRLDGQMWFGDGHRENSDFDTETLALRADVRPEPWGMHLEWRRLRRDAGVPGPESFPSPSARQADERDSLRADVTYLAGRWSFKAGVNRAEQSLEYADPEPPSFDPAFPAEPIRSLHENTARGADFQWDFDTGQGELYTLGGEWTEDRIVSTNDGDREMLRWGLYAQDQWRYRSWSTVLALRRDQHSVYGGQTSPSVSVAWESGGWQVWTATARGYRAPNFDDLYWSDQYTKGNPGLEPESSWSFEGGIGAILGEAVRARVKVFRRDVDNLIRWADLDGDFVYQPENVARAGIDGFEAELVYRPSVHFSIPLGYQRLDARDDESGERLPGSVRSLWRAAVRSAGAPWTWSFEAARTDRGEYPMSGERWAHTVFNAALGWKGAIGKLPLRAEMRWENITDREYQTVEGYPMPGRSLFVEVSVGI